MQKTHSHSATELTATDKMTAEELWQYKEPHSSLRFNLSVPMTLLQKQLNLFLDATGVIRCQGCINNARLPSNSKTPILLPSHGHFTKLLIILRHS